MFSWRSIDVYFQGKSNGKKLNMSKLRHKSVGEKSMTSYEEYMKLLADRPVKGATPNSLTHTKLSVYFLNK